jgi:TonB-linked SusC/RagA family outer membrane protein
MKTQEVAITGQSVINVKLMADTENLDEVVVTAMGIKRSEKALGYAATSVKSDEIVEQRTDDVMSGLAGKVAGVQISSASSDPGSSKSVVIRGYTSISGSNQPLYVVDGVPINNSTTSSSSLNGGYDFGNGANAIDPNNVESMTILKGAAATALYGSRAANGVVMITTKSGTKGKGLGVTYNGGFQWSNVLRIPEFQNQFGMGWYGEHTETENGSWGPEFDGSWVLWGNVYDNSQKVHKYEAQEDNVKDFFDIGFRQSHSVTFDGGTDNGTFNASVSYISDDGIMPTDADSYDKYSFSTKNTYKKDNLSFTTALNYTYQENSYTTTGQGLSVYNSIMQTPRDVCITALSDLSDPFNMPGYYYTPYSVTNPYYILNYYENTHSKHRFYGKFETSYKFLDDFNITYRFGLDFSSGLTEFGEPNLYDLFYEGTANGSEYGTSSTFTGETGYVYEGRTQNTEINQDVLVTYDKKVNELTFNAIAGFNGYQRTNTSEYAYITDLTIPYWYDLSNTDGSPTASDYEYQKRMMSVFGQLETSWRDMLFVTLTARNDWSSTLPEDNRSFFYFGSTGSFLFSELIDSDVIDFGKFRVAYGKTGNDASAYMTDSYYSSGYSSGYWADYEFPYSDAGYNAFTVGNTIGSDDLEPEMTTEFEVGLNMAFLDNRVSVDAAVYNRVSNNQISTISLDYSSGYSSMNANIGDIRNRGIELLVNVTPIRIGDFSWDLTVSYSKDKSKVIELAEELGDELQIYGFTGGTGLYAIEGQPLGVFKAEVPKYTVDGQIIVDEDTGIPEPETEYQKVGDMNYDYQMGLSTTFKYKTISLSANVDIRQGGLMYSRTKDIMYFTGNAKQTAYNDRNPFVIPNSVYEDDNGNYIENSTALDIYNIYDYWDGGGSDLGSGFLIDKSYVKLRSVIASWTVPTKWLTNKFIQGADVSVYGNNLLVWTAKSNTFVDPESSTFGNDLSGNFGEYSANPSARRFGFNVKLKF